MKNKNLILLLAAGAAYWYFFMYKKKKQALPPVIQPGMPDVPGSSTPAAAQMQPAVTTEAVSIVDQIKSFSEPMRQLEHKQDEGYITYYVNQVSGVKRVGVPYTV
jgi:hypothetical protein